MAATTFAGVKVPTSSQRVVRSRQSVPCVATANEAQNRRQLFIGLGAMLAAAAVTPAAKADLTSDLLAKSEANKAANDKKRLLSSYANVQRSRTVQDGSCAVPFNFLGCGENPAFIKVKYISDSATTQCQGKEYGKCGSGWK